jgi:hypothetical protein
MILVLPDLMLHVAQRILDLVSIAIMIGEHYLVQRCPRFLCCEALKRVVRVIER